MDDNQGQGAHSDTVNQYLIQQRYYVFFFLSAPKGTLAKHRVPTVIMYVPFFLVYASSGHG